MSDDLPVRQAVRALLLDPDNRVLMVRFEFRDVGTVWAMPGGGIEANEEPLEALHRELIEEVGFRTPEIGPFIWDMNRVIPSMNPHGWSGQRDIIHFVPCNWFEPQPALTWDEMRSEGVHELRWWTAEEVANASAEVLFAPRRFPALLASLIEAGHPPEPVVFFENH